MRSGKATAAEVARKAGVSVSAVSRVFNPGRSASSTMATRVMKAAQELDYRPNLLARSLSVGRTRMIGLVVPYLYNQYYAEVLEGLSVALQAEGYHVLVFVVPKTAISIDQVVDDLLNYRVDGLIVASVAISSQLAERCTEAGVPVLLFNRIEDHQNFPSVTSDNLGGGRMAGEHLLELGHRRIGYIAGWEGASTQRDREAGFVEALAKGGVQLVARGAGNYVREDACDAAQAMFDRSDHPTAVFVANDFMAFAVLDKLRHGLGLRVPEDVSVMGYGDIAMAAWPAYALTTVRQPTAKMVKRSVDLLLKMVGEPDDSATSVVLKSTLIKRATTAQPKEERSAGV